jgi:hypothetical protein
VFRVILRLTLGENNIDTILGKKLTGWPDMENFRLLSECFFWAFYWKLQKIFGLHV